MPLESKGVEHLDKSKDLSITLSQGNEKGGVFGTAFVDGYKEGKTGPGYNSAGASVGAFSTAGHSASMTAEHVPGFGGKLTTAGTVNLLKTDSHKVDVNAFTTRNFPKNPFPNFSTHGAGVNYQYKDVAHAAASVAHTPIAQRTDYLISSGVKLHQTPTSSFSVNASATRTDSPFSKGNWQPGGFFHYEKKF